MPKSKKANKAKLDKKVISRNASAPIAKTEALRSYFNVSASKDLNRTTIRGMEPIVPVNGSIGFTKVFDEYVNPVNDLMCPRLAVEAAIYEKYRFKKVTFHYSGRCSTTSSGQVGLLFIPDPYENESAGSMLDIERYEISRSCVPWSNTSISYSWKGDSLVWFHTTAETALSNGSTSLGTLRTSVPGVFQIYTSGFSAAVLAGNVYIEYECELIERRPALQALAAIKNVPYFVGTTTSTTFGGIPLLPYIGLSDSNLDYSSGYLAKFINRSNDALVSVSGAVASYIAAMQLNQGSWFSSNASVTANQSFKIPRGDSILSLLASFGAIGSGVQSLDPPPLKRYPVSTWDEKSDPTRGATDDPVAPYEIKADEKGFFYKMYDGDSWHSMSGVHSSEPLVTNDWMLASYLYNPASNTGSVINLTSNVNNSSAYSQAAAIKISNAATNVLYLIPYVYTQLAANTGRSVDISVQLANLASF